MIKPIFLNLKNNYQTNSNQIHKCNMVFPNTCAIRMSEALLKTDPMFAQMFKMSVNKRCPHDYIRGAQDPASFLARKDVYGIRDYGWNGNDDGTPPKGVKGKRGIVCYMDIPEFSGQGHIDLWDGDYPVGNECWDAKTIWMWVLK